MTGLENPFLKLGFDNPKRKREFPLRECLRSELVKPC